MSRDRSVFRDKVNWYKNGENQYKDVLVLEMKRVIIVSSETINRHNEARPADKAGLAFSVPGGCAMNYLTEPLNSSQDEPVDINSVTIDPTLSREDRITEFLKQIKNPYHFECGGIEIHACYSEDGPTLMECLKQLIDG